MDNRLLRFARLALAVSRAGPREQVRAGHRPQPQLFACLLIKEYLRLDYRTAEELIAAADELRAALRLHRAPDHTTLWWFDRHRVQPEIIRAALEGTISRAGPDGDAAGHIRPHMIPDRP